MAFSRSQLARHFRPMRDRAWAAHCRRECITESTPASKRTWYEHQLTACFSRKVTSSTELNPKSDFEKAMAWFEELAGEGIYWQNKWIKGDQNRALYITRETIRNLRLTDSYIGAICERMGIKTVLRDCTAEQLLDLRTALLKHCRRQQDRVVKGAP